MNILLGISGSVAAFKGIILARLLSKKGHVVRTILTLGGREFVSPLQISSLTGEPCYLDEDFFVESDVPLHLDLAQWADLLIIAPATANTIARFRVGLADDLLSATYLAFDKMVIIAPAMHEAMWNSDSTRENVDALALRGNIFVGPYTGDLSTGEIGMGRMAEPEEIAAVVEDVEGKINVLRGKKFLVSLGRTEEDMDPVRVVTNRSSGRMGISLVRIFKALGAKVFTVSGEVSYPLPKRDDIIKVRSGEEMFQAMKELLPEVDVVVMVAAVSDFKPKTLRKDKIKRGKKLVVEFEPTRDILRELSGMKRSDQVFVGFALEEGDLLRKGKKKLKEKGLDLLIANRFSAIGSEVSEGVILTEGEKEEFESLTKGELALRIVDWILRAIEKKTH